MANQRGDFETQNFTQTHTKRLTSNTKRAIDYSFAKVNGD
jgi:hypothetical protein